MNQSRDTFFWHDYETFGKEPRRDRPAQFAGVRTDTGLREIGDPVDILCQPAPDFLPDPVSVLITGILPQQALEQGVPEHLFAARIESELALPGTIGVGYNSIRFDDEITRFLFWRSLLDPYAREWQNGCSRWDLLDVVRCAWALRPEGIEWPRHESGKSSGKPSFRLEHLTRANGLAHEHAHDALSDVRATIALARLLREKQPKLWEFCLNLRSKDAVRTEIGTNRPFLHISGRYPVEHGCMAVVWPLATHPNNRNEVIVWDLSRDPAELASLDAATVKRRLHTRSVDLPEGEQRLPIKTVHLNRSPIVIASEKMMALGARRWGFDLGAIMRHAGHAAAFGRKLDGLWSEVYARPAPAQPPDVDEDLYGGFLGDEDRRRLGELRTLAVEQGPERLAQRRMSFDDGRLDELSFRWRARNFPATLDADESARWLAHRRARLIDGEGGAMTLAAFFERIDALAEEADERAEDLLSALYDYAGSIVPE